MLRTTTLSLACLHGVTPQAAEADYHWVGGLNVFLPGVDQLVAAITVLYLGTMTYQNSGRLGPGIAYHFWSDVFVGIESAVLIARGQPAKPVTANFALSW